MFQFVGSSRLMRAKEWYGAATCPAHRPRSPGHLRWRSSNACGWTIHRTAYPPSTITEKRAVALPVSRSVRLDDRAIIPRVTGLVDMTQVRLACFRQILRIAGNRASPVGNRGNCQRPPVAPHDGRSEITRSRNSTLRGVVSPFSNPPITSWPHSATGWCASPESPSALCCSPPRTTTPQSERQDEGSVLAGIAPLPAIPAVILAVYPSASGYQIAAISSCVSARLTLTADHRNHTVGGLSPSVPAFGPPRCTYSRSPDRTARRAASVLKRQSEVLSVCSDLHKGPISP